MKQISSFIKSTVFASLLMIWVPVQAASASQGSDAGVLSFNINIILIIAAVLLFVPIWILGNTLIQVAKISMREKIKRDLRIWLPLGFLLISDIVHAQGQMSETGQVLRDHGLTIALCAFILLEFILILILSRLTNSLLKGIHPEVIPQKVGTQSPWEWIKEKWMAMNFRQPIEEEHKIDTGHSYDGIRELDNVTPPWFTFAFVLSIVFAGVYMYRYHIAKSAPLQLEELAIEMARADLEHEEYLKRAANNIDENNIPIMSGADLDGGKKVFETLCAACHKIDGGGLVGPNLTDEYWLHGGSLQNIFKVVKYGVPDKGMISWKEQLSPLQMAQVSNYILTLQGNNPPDAKEPQGELYVVLEDTTAVQTAPVEGEAIRDTLKAN